jgi:hypothetical protein
MRALSEYDGHARSVSLKVRHDVQSARVTGNNVVLVTRYLSIARRPLVAGDDDEDIVSVVRMVFLVMVDSFSIDIVHEVSHRPSPSTQVLLNSLLLG